MGLFDLFQEKPVEWVEWVDGQGNFTIHRPNNFRYDTKVAVVDGKYTISFEGHKGRFVVSLDTKPAIESKFEDYAMEQITGPASGVHSIIKKTKFRNFDAFTREYSFSNQNERYFGGGIIFYTGEIVFDLSWSAPEKSQTKYSTIFSHMLESLEF